MLESKGLQRIGHDWQTEQQEKGTASKIWQVSPLSFCQILNLMEWKAKLKIFEGGNFRHEKEDNDNYESEALEGYIQEIRWTAKSWWNPSMVLWRQIYTNDRNQHGTLDKFSSQDFARFSSYMRWEANELNKTSKGQTESPIVFKCWKEIDLPSYRSEVQMSHTLRKKARGRLSLKLESSTNLVQFLVVLRWSALQIMHLTEETENLYEGKLHHYKSHLFILNPKYGI